VYSVCVYAVELRSLVSETVSLVPLYTQRLYHTSYLMSLFSVRIMHAKSQREPLLSSEYQSILLKEKVGRSADATDAAG
jgi:hypothetical protein